MSRVRNYCFTLNNYTDEELDKLSKLDVEYMIYGKEVAPTTGTPHLQGFVKFKHAKTFTAVKKLIPRAHLEVMKGTIEDCIKYCSKQGDVTEYGKKPPGAGSRSDLTDIKKCIEQQKKVKDLLKNNIIKNYQGVKYAETLQKYYEKPRMWETKVEWFYGPTETGKTRTAYEIFSEITDIDNIYAAMDTGKWWDGYDGQEYVIIDDIRKDFMKFHQLLKLLDRYPYRVETKGSTRQFVAKHIIITSPFRPEELYETREDIGQLIRRIHNIRKFE